jgi:hypothetical protein
MNPEMKRDPAGIVGDVPSLGQPRSRVQPIVGVHESVVDEAEGLDARERSGRMRSEVVA